MAKKTQKDLVPLQNAVEEIRKIKKQVVGKNPFLDEAMEKTERDCLNRLYVAVSQNIKKTA